MDILEFLTYIDPCPRSRAWQTWTKLEDELLAPEAFADLIDEHLEDLTSGDGYPKPLDLVELGRDLRVHTKGTFEKKVDPRTGAFALVNRLDMEQSSTPVPRAFLLAIAVFDGGSLYKVEARLKLRVSEGKPGFAFTLHRRLEIERDAFGDVRKIVAEKCDLPIFAGSPER